MDSVEEILDSLKALGYAGPCLNVDKLQCALKNGTRNAEFREVTSWLAQELHILRNTDEKVSADIVDSSEFGMELSGMLKELGCPYSKLIHAPLSERFISSEDNFQLFDFLITQLMAVKMTLHSKPKKAELIIAKSETDTARSLKQLTIDLALGKPPDNVSIKAYFDKLNFKLEELQRQVKAAVLGEPLLRMPKQLTEAQWKQLDAIQAGLNAEYNLRRKMMLTRLDVTIQTFQWSESSKIKQPEIEKLFQQKWQQLEQLEKNNDKTNIVALLAARSDLAIIEKTSSANVRKNTGCKIQKHIIGSVPDRGGRANEHAPPPPEMPSWQQQRASGPPGGARGGFGGAGNYQRGGGGGGAGRGGGRGGNQYYQQNQVKPQFQEQRQRFDNNRNQQQWAAGTGRVQGTGWSQDNVNGGGYNNQNNGYNNYRGQTSYQRGGRGGSGRGGGQRR